MFKFKKESLVFYFSIAFFVLALGLFVPLARPLVLNLFKSPLMAVNFIGKEIKGIILYHKNYTENENLNKEVGLLKFKLNKLEEISNENDRLRKLLSFKEEAQFKVIPARVFARSADSWASELVVDKGSSTGVKKGMVVINYVGLVGRVIEVSRSLSKVLLINDATIGVSSLVQRSRQEGLVSGTLGNSLIMRYLPKEADIEVGDEIITSGFTENFPKGLLIGTVTELGNDLSGLSRYAIIKPSANLSGIEEVLIISP